MVTQAPATAFACSQLATLAQNTQAPATAFACSQLATLAQKKRCLGTATQSLGVFVRCRQSRPLWFQLPQWLRRRLTPLAFSSVGRTPFVKHSYAGLHSTSGVSGVRLRFAPADARHALSSAAALLRCASLSLCPLGRSKKRCLGTATQSLGVFVRCRQSRPLCAQLTIACLFVGVVQSGTLVAPCGRSAAFPLLHLSPSLATLGHLPRWGVNMSSRCCAHRRSGKPAALPTHRCAQKAVGSVFVRCRQSRPLGATGTLNYK